MLQSGTLGVVREREVSCERRREAVNFEGETRVVYGGGEESEGEEASSSVKEQSSLWLLVHNQRD